DVGSSGLLNPPSLSTGTVSGGGWVFVDSDGVFNNLAGSTLDIQNNDHGFARYNGVGTAAFNNAGMLRRSPATSQAVFLGVSFANTGQVQVQSGTLNFAGGFTQTAGSTILS